MRGDGINLNYALLIKAHNCNLPNCNLQRNRTKVEHGVVVVVCVGRSLARPESELNGWLRSQKESRF